MNQPSTHPGSLHMIPRHSSLSKRSPLVAFSHNPHNTSTSPENTLIFLGGLFDGLLTVPYTPALAARTPAEWQVVEPILSSSYRQWGLSGLNEDVQEIADVVNYFRGGRGGKVVLMGHSTGCQMIMHYLLAGVNDREGEERQPKVDGALLQASVSDREAMTFMLHDDELHELCRLARKFVNEKKADEVLPIASTEKGFGPAPVTARRFLSLASPGPGHVGEDDYFSSDFSDERLSMTFGKLGQAGARLAFLFGGRDQYVPEFVDKEKLVKRWQTLIRDGGGTVDGASGILEGATHNVKEGAHVLDVLVEKVNGFLGRL